jgi:hypothetical protein
MHDITLNSFQRFNNDSVFATFISSTLANYTSGNLVADNLSLAEYL